MTKSLPRITEVVDLLNKPLLIPWATGLVVEFMQEKTAEIVLAPINELLNEIKDMQLVKTEAMTEKLRIIRDSINENFLSDNSKILKEAKLQPEKIKNETADKGRRVHAAIEKFLQAKDGTQVEVDEDIAIPFRSFLDFWILNDIEVVETECAVWSEEGGGFKGTFDLSAYLKKDNKKILYLIDFKTGVRIYPGEASMQLAAYFYAWKQRTKFIPERAAIVRFDREKKVEAEFFELLEHEVYVYYQAFLKLVEYWHLINEGIPF